MSLISEYAMQFVGTNYRWGGDDPMDGFDCSGFVQEILHAFGCPTPTDMNAQAMHDWLVKAKAPAVKLEGALVFFGKSAKEITHVGLLISPDLMIEAGGGGSKTQSRTDAAKQNAYIRVRPVERRKDIVAIRFPDYKFHRLIAEPVFMG